MSTSLLIAGIFAFVYFHSIFSPEKYKSLTVDEGRNLVYKLDVKEIPKTYSDWKASEQLYHYTLLDNYSKFTVIWTKVIGFITFYLILLLFNKFLKNTTNYNFFFEKNIIMINQMVKLVLFLFIFNLVFSSFMSPMEMTFYEQGEPHHILSGKITFELFIYYPIVIIFFLVLKEVFKRGQELKQENELTI